MKRGALIGVLAMGAVGAGSGSAPGQGPAFIGVGDLPGGNFSSRVCAVDSREEVHVVGESVGANGPEAFLWTTDAGMMGLGRLEPGDQFSRATAMFLTFGDPIVVGQSGFEPAPFEARAFIWSEANGMEPLGPFAGGGHTELPLGMGINGPWVVGIAGAASGAPQAFAGSQGFTAIAMQPLPGASQDYSAAHAGSADDLTIVGYTRDAAFTTHAVRWFSTFPPVSLGHLNSTGFQDSRAYAVSAGGNVIAGESTSDNGSQEAFRWTETAGMQGLGDLPGGGFRSVALAMSIDGTLVLGWSETAKGNRAFIWDAPNGMRDLKTVLAAQGFNVSGWTLTQATGITIDKLAIAGDGINPVGQPEGWVADLEGCYADCNASGALSVADFTCFQAKFAAGDPYANCNHSGGLTVADFVCFQAKFVAGCP